jgi:hypothetical protein
MRFWSLFRLSEGEGGKGKGGENPTIFLALIPLPRLSLERQALFMTRQR